MYYMNYKRTMNTCMYMNGLVNEWLGKQGILCNTERKAGRRGCITDLTFETLPIISVCNLCIFGFAKITNRLDIANNSHKLIHVTLSRSNVQYETYICFDGMQKWTEYISRRVPDICENDICVSEDCNHKWLIQRKDTSIHRWNVTGFWCQRKAGTIKTDMFMNHVL